MLVLLLGGVLGWQWQARQPLVRIEVTGTQHADRDALVGLAGLDSSMTLYDIDPVIVADRVRRHPWVADARVWRLPNGTLSIRVEERQPALLVIDRRGRPERYLDPAGFQMPVVASAAYNVPLLRGLEEDYNPVQPVRQESLRELLAALPGLDPELDALISELEIRAPGEIWLYTPPLTDHDAIPVRLGRSGYAIKLQRLQAYWRQAVLPRPDKAFKMIDLRFDSQIITQEETTE
jgi:cell division protein FtsQ